MYLPQLGLPDNRIAKMSEMDCNPISFPIFSHNRVDTREDDEDELTQEDTWTVIGVYFEEKGLVRQQLDSFDEFLTNQVQELVDDTPDLQLVPESQHKPGSEANTDQVHSPWRG